MTNDTVNLQALLEKTTDPDFLRKMIGFTAQRQMAIELQITKLRNGSYFPGFFEPRRMAKKGPTAVIQEAYVQGVSTRTVDDLIQAMGMSGISKSQVFRLCGEVDKSRPS